MSEPPPKKIRQLTLNAFITTNSNNNRSRESDVPNQNVRPAENEQGERSGSLPSTQAGRRFQPNWKDSFPWLVYNASRDVITCEACSWAVENNKTTPAAKLALEGQSKAWISGFNAWRRGRAALSKHQNSQHHKECMNVRCTLWGKNNTNVLDQLISARRATAASNFKALRGIFNAVLLCGRQGLALRGHTDESSNFRQIINLIAKHDGDMQAWLTRQNTYKWFSHDIMNEILEMTSHAVLRDLVKEVQVAKYFSIICDETTDVSTTEQLSICVRYVDSAWAIKEVFLGLHAAPKCDSETLTTIVKSCLLSLNLPLSNCRGQAYDGAANMRGNISGVQARIKESNKTAVYVYCMGHQLNLVVQECITNTVEGENALEILNKVSKFVTASPKRLESFRAFQLCMSETQDHLNLRPLCPTRWVLRKASLDAFLSNYQKLLDWLCDMFNSTDEHAKLKSQAQSYLLSLEKYEVYFYLKIMQVLLRHFHAVHVAIQSRNLSMSMAKQLISKLSNVLQIESSSEKNATDFYQQVAQSASSIGVGLPSLPRCFGRRSQRQVSLLSVNSHYSSLYSNIFKSAHNLLITRFLMNDIGVAIDLENVLSLAGNEQTTRSIAEFYESDVDLSMLNTELAEIRLLHSNDVKSPDDLHALFQSHNELPLLFTNLATLLRIFLTLPCTTCEAERSFSVVRHIKTYLRSRMTQPRLNHCCLLNVHSESCDRLDLEQVMNAWIQKAAVRINTFK